MALSIVFMGTPDFSVPVLDAILKAGHRVVAVYCQPPRPAGRGMAEQLSPVHRFAEAKGLRVLIPLNFKTDTARTAFADYKAEAAVVVAYGLILPEDVLSAPRLGCFNVHASKLPRWRGAAPIHRAIMAGDSDTAVMVMRMDRGLDTGPVCLGRELPISDDMTAGQLHDQLAAAGAEVMVEALARLEAGSLNSVPQSNNGVTYAAKISKSETRIDFTKSSRDVANHIRGLSPSPGAWFEIDTGAKPERIKVLAAKIGTGTGSPGTVIDDHLTVACGSGAVSLIEIQRAGKKPVPADEFLRGYRIGAGQRLV